MKDKVDSEEVMSDLSYEKFPGLVIDNQLSVTISGKNSFKYVYIIWIRHVDVKVLLVIYYFKKRSIYY